VGQRIRVPAVRGGSGAGEGGKTTPGETINFIRENRGPPPTARSKTGKGEGTSKREGEEVGLPKKRQRWGGRAIGTKKPLAGKKKKTRMGKEKSTEGAAYKRRSAEGETLRPISLGGGRDSSKWIKGGAKLRGSLDWCGGSLVATIPRKKRGGTRPREKGRGTEDRGAREKSAGKGPIETPHKPKKNAPE